MGQHLGSRAGNFEDLPARRAGIVPNLILRTAWGDWIINMRFCTNGVMLINYLNYLSLVFGIGFI